MQRSASKMRGRGRSIRKKPSNCSGIRVSLPLHQRICDVCHNLGDSRRNDPRPLRLISPLRMMTPRHVRFEIQTATEPDKQTEEKITDRQTDRQKRKTQTERKHKRTYKQTDRQKKQHRQTDREKNTNLQTEEKNTDKQTEGETQTDRQTNQTDREKNTNRQTDRQKGKTQTGLMQSDSAMKRMRSNTILENRSYRQWV